MTPNAYTMRCDKAPQSEGLAWGRGLDRELGEAGFTFDSLHGIGCPASNSFYTQKKL